MSKNILLNFFSSIVLIALLSLVLCLFLPWWSIAIAACMVSIFIPMKAGINFVAGFLSLAITWGALSFYISWKNNHLLAHKVSLLMLKSDNPFLLMLMTMLIGGLVGGMGALCGGLLRKNKN